MFYVFRLRLFKPMTLVIILNREKIGVRIANTVCFQRNHTAESSCTSGSLERRVTRGGDSFLLRLVTKSVSCPIISMYFIRTLTTGHSSNTLTSVL